MKQGDFVFVYGTLRRGQGADLSRDPRARFLGDATIPGRIYNLGWYPGVKPPVDDTERVSGEVFEILDDALPPRLDTYEGYPHLYNRVETVTEKGDKVWVYVYNGQAPDSALIPSGDWLQRG